MGRPGPGQAGGSWTPARRNSRVGRSRNRLRRDGRPRRRRQLGHRTIRRRSRRRRTPRAGSGSTPAVWCHNTRELLAIRLRPGNANANHARDHIAVHGDAIAQIPRAHCRWLLVRADTAGATHRLLDWLHAHDRIRGRRVECSIGFPAGPTDRSRLGTLENRPERLRRSPLPEQQRPPRTITMITKQQQRRPHERPGLERLRVCGQPRCRRPSTYITRNSAARRATKRDESRGSRPTPQSTLRHSRDAASANEETEGDPSGGVES
jgi:hypothetical protein